jgi:hypothetical protein
MYAIEFKSKIKNGVIEIPREYRNRLKESVRVIVLAEEKETTFNVIDRLLNSPLKAENFTPLTREEIYERR